MKIIHKVFCLTLLTYAAFLSSCQEDDNNPARPGTVRFTLQHRVSADAPDGRVTQSLPEGAKLYVSIATTAGEEVYSLREVTLVNMGGYAVSEPLALNTGDYILTRFIVAGDQVSYVAPQEGSPLAQWVEDPLPIAFTVEDNTIAGLQVQVLPFDETNAPQDFGYVGFGIQVAAYPYFNLSVFTLNENGLAFIPVRASILQGADTVFSQALPAGINAIAFVGDMEAIYQLVLEQPGYARYTVDFTLPTLLETLISSGKKALEIALRPAFTFVTRYNRGAAFSVVGSSLDELTVDWGDGTIEPLVPVIADQVEHEYTGDKDHYFVSVYGNDLNHIEELGFFYDFGSLKEITLDNLPALRRFRQGFAAAPPVVDFSHNPVLHEIEMIIANARSIVLAEDATVRYILLMGNNDTFQQSSLDHIIDVSYRAAVEGRMPVGTLALETMYTVPRRLIVTPSSDALEKLRALRDVYGWSISPDEF
ncbi:hypothetical protein [Dawidia soli]|uniref:Uncharacterized protein n=1 Tax=Dawidia soli TaxID=2782352 RepID=A0AAP2DCT3_9BACT|nr:hypothetical protein [Dawidia soli]MBT1686982.1 hypothetical protein [Dawidia soli]